MLQRGMTLTEARSLSYDEMLIWEAHIEYAERQKQLAEAVRSWQENGDQKDSKTKTQIQSLTNQAMQLEKEFYGKY